MTRGDKRGLGSRLRRWGWAACCVWGAVWGTGTAFGETADQVDFNGEVRRVLADNCFKCHGPDASGRKGGKGGLRLDTSEGAQADLGGRQAIVPGHPERSELIRRVTTADPAHRMPPRSGKTLSPQQIILLTRWIAQGAEYARLWSYLKPHRPELPAVKDPVWPRNAVDRFILARLENEGLRPAPEAEREALVRRVSLDLTGLPPELSEVDRFVNDPEAGAFERLVDRLLEQPAFGEHWARWWLDQARYADSAGYADDPPRTIWAYRDYVIRSFNANQPFDQFTLEQIAGDLLPNPTEDQLVATGFHRNTLTNNEGGTSDEEYRNVAIVDRVNTTMAVWMGTTMGCAQCHDHKYDPITQQEYFRLFAVLNQSEDADRMDESPVLGLYSQSQVEQRGELARKIAPLELVVETATPALVDAQARWEAGFATDPAWYVLRPSLMKSLAGAAMSQAPDGAIRAARGGKTDVYTLEIPLVAGGTLAALRLETLPDETLPGKGAGYADGNFSVTRVRTSVSRREVQPAPEPSSEFTRDGARAVEFNAAYADYSQKDSDAASVLGRKDPAGEGWGVAPEVGKAHRLTLVPASPVEVPVGSKLTVTIEQRSKLEYATLGQLRLLASPDPRAEEHARTPAPILAILKAPPGERSASQREQLSRYYRSIAPALQPEREQLAGLKKRLEEIKPYTTAPVMRELAAENRRQTHIQHRGNFLDLGQEVTAGLPACFHPLPDGAPTNRLGLARWLVDENNPLTARVMANRLWESLFGIGIVRTSEEFGSQGEAPSHPELLDWLATELVGQKWDLKHLIRLMVTSAAYRQASRVTPESLARDPENRLVSRGPRFRLAAEMVRDQALRVSGLLSPKLYGPPVKPPQPKTGLSAAFGGDIDWQTSTGEDRYRRALYTLWRRSNPYPSLATFDAPNREVCMVRRARSNTPLQALVTLNDPVYVEAAQALARRMASDGTNPAEKAGCGFRRCLGRRPAEQELQALLQLYGKAYARFAGDPDRARQVATQPAEAPPEGSDVAELAAWTVVANVILNLDEMLMKR